MSNKYLSNLNIRVDDNIGSGNINVTSLEGMDSHGGQISPKGTSQNLAIEMKHLNLGQLMMAKNVTSAAVSLSYLTIQIENFFNCLYFQNT